MELNTFENILRTIYSDMMKSLYENPKLDAFPILKYTVKAWNIGEFYKMLSNTLRIKTSELILSKTLNYRFNPVFNSNVSTIKLENGQIILNSCENSDITVIEINDELIKAYLVQ